MALELLCSIIEGGVKPSDDTAPFVTFSSVFPYFEGIGNLFFKFTPGMFLSACEGHAAACTQSVRAGAYLYACSFPLETVRQLLLSNEP